MKTKSLKLFFSLLLCGIFLVACFLFVPPKVYAEEQQVSPFGEVIEAPPTEEPPTLPTKTFSVSVIERNETSTTFTSTSQYYSYNDKGQDITLGLDVDEDFKLGETDTVAYYFKKLDTNSVVFNYLGTIDNTFKDKDGNIKKDDKDKVIPNPNRELTRNFFIDYGAGEYLIKAVILKDGVFNAVANDLRITIEDLTLDEKLKANIYIKNFGVLKGKYDKYNFSIKFEQGGETVEFSNYNVEWYYTLTNDEYQTESETGEEKKSKQYYIGTDLSVDWTPTKDGDYTIIAKIRLGKIQLQDAEDSLNIKKNYSLYAIIALAGVAVVLTTIVIITSIRKVKKERVW